MAEFGKLTIRLYYAHAFPLTQANQDFNKYGGVGNEIFTVLTDNATKKKIIIPDQIINKYK